jgi:DnaK suppressor protein
MMSHLTPQELASLEQQLNQREALVRAQIRVGVGHREDEPYAELAGSVGDLADDASADLIVDIDNAMIGIELAELRDIEAARTRIMDRRYGICVDCDQDIEYARLQAYPTAKRCTVCQNMHERTYASQSRASM